MRAWQRMAVDSVTDTDQRKAELWGVACGLWGVISGIALFLTWDAFWRTEPWWVVPAELMLAVLAAFVAEQARERVELRSERASSIFTSVLILVVLEFFILGWHGIPSLETGDLREISRRILGEASVARSAKFYAFDLPDPARLQLQFRAAEAALSTSNEREKQREQVANRILQLLSPEHRRVLLDNQTPASDLARVLKDALNSAISSIDFYLSFHGEREGGDGLSASERPAIPPAPEMRRMSRRLIEQSFQGAIAPTPEEDRTEWIDLALGVAPLLIVGLLLGWNMVQNVDDISKKRAKAGMGCQTCEGMLWGAVSGALGGFVAFFAYVALMRLGYFVVSHDVPRMLLDSISHYVPQDLRALVSPHGSPPLSVPCPPLHFLIFPVMGQMAECVGPAVRAALMFALPGATLGALVPWLKPPSRSPKFWSLIASIAAALSVLVSLLSHNRCWWIAIGSSLALMILWSIHQGKSIEWYWATAGFVVALFLCALTVTAQATLGNFMKDMHLFIQREIDTRSGSFDASWVMNLRVGEWKDRERLDQDPFHAWFAAYTWNRKRDGGTPGQPPRAWDSGRHAGNGDLAEMYGCKVEYDEDQARQRAESRAVGQALEVFVMGGLGFWVTIGALAAWKILGREGQGETG